jgi:D-3-phosphoglycerate dehydrogenase
MFRILITDIIDQAGHDCLTRASDVDYDVRLNLSPSELQALIAEYDAVIVRSGTKLDASVINAGDKLKVIGRAGSGVDNIDIEAATLRGIIVTNAPEANTIAAAEHTLALLLAAARRLVPAHLSLVEGEWRRSHFVGQQLHGNVLGVIGFGRIGRQVTQRAQAFGMEVIAYDPYVSEGIAREYGITLVDLDDLLAESAYITLHTAPTAETDNILNAAAFAQMRDGMIVVNVAHGRLIDEVALLDALNSGKVAGAALDVFQHEPPADSPLIGHPHVIHAPHLGAATVEARYAVATQIVDQVLDALHGIDYRNAVNMPFRSGPPYPIAKPYLELAEKMGILQAHMADSPITRVEIEAAGDIASDLVRPMAAALLKGILAKGEPGGVNYVNAPILAERRNITIARTKGLGDLDYSNLISCRAYWNGGQRLMAGVLFGGSEPRIVQVADYRLEAKPEGHILLMLNRDVPGVIGQVGTILAAYNVNIAEWRLGRSGPGGEALSFINLDSTPPDVVINALASVPAIKKVTSITL